MAAEVNAVVASAGDFYRFRDFGAVVYQGEAKRVEGTYAETCYIDANGDMHFTYGGDVLTVEDVQTFVDERDIQFSLAFGPILVDNYEELTKNLSENAISSLNAKEVLFFQKKVNMKLLTWKEWKMVMQWQEQIIWERI